MPTSSPVRLRSSTTGNSTCESPTVRLTAEPWRLPVNSGAIAPASTIHRPVTTPRAIRMIQNSVEASRNASFLRPAWSRSVNTGTNAADSAACENRLLIRFGTCEAIVKAEAAALVPKKLAATTSRARPAIRESAVARAKIAVLRAIRRRGGGGGEESGGSPPTMVSTDTSAL